VSGIPLPQVHRFSTLRHQKKLEENGPDAVEMLPPDADRYPVEMPKPKELEPRLVKLLAQTRNHIGMLKDLALQEKNPTVSN
jgi:hypothetical protein